MMKEKLRIKEWPERRISGAKRANIRDCGGLPDWKDESCDFDVAYMVGLIDGKNRLKVHDIAIEQAARKELLKDLQKFIDNADSHIGCPNGTLGTAYLIQWMGGQG